MNKKGISVVLIFTVLIIITFVSLKLNNQSVEIQKNLLNRAEFILTDGLNEITLSQNNIKHYGEEEFNAVLDTSSSDAKLHNYVGIQLKKIIFSNNVDIKDKEAVIISAADGYSVAYSIEEVLKDDNIYIAYMEDGKYLGNRENGGRGPYESIVVSDMFSNRRCKWVTKIEVR